MDIREGDRARNNRIIFITAALICLLVLLSLQRQPHGKMVKISIGDDSFQVANMLNREGVPFTAHTGAAGDGVVVAYTPLSPWARLNKKAVDSSYEIRFDQGRVAEIVWRDRQGKLLGRPLFVELVGGP